jgi:3-methyladenine DNA glycosylase AlkD
MYEKFVPDTASEIKTLSELAAELDVSYFTVRQWARDGISGCRLRVCRTTRGMGTTYKEYDSFIKSINSEQRWQSAKD